MCEFLLNKNVWLNLIISRFFEQKLSISKWDGFLLSNYFNIAITMLLNELVSKVYGMSWGAKQDSD